MTTAEPLCTASHGRPCAACEPGGSKAEQRIPSNRCLFAPGIETPRVEATDPKTYCCCNHCFYKNGERRYKEKSAAHSLADALEGIVADLAGGGIVETDGGWIEKARAALRAAGRLPEEKQMTIESEGSGATAPRTLFCDVCGRAEEKCERGVLRRAGFRCVASSDCYRLGYGRLRAAILWALGNTGGFRTQAEGEGRYYWRKELRARAFVSGEPRAAPSEAVTETREEEETP